MRRYCFSKVLVICAALATFACNKKEEPAAVSQVAPLPPEEVARARTACQSYLARVCACAESDGEFAPECSMAKARPSALEVNLELLEATGLDEGERKALKVEARKIAAGCFEADARLDIQRCPRVVP